MKKKERLQRSFRKLQIREVERIEIQDRFGHRE